MAHWNVQYDWENPNTNIILIKIHAVHIIYNILYDEIHVTLNSPNNINYIYMCQYILRKLVYMNMYVHRLQHSSIVAERCYGAVIWLV